MLAAQLSAVGEQSREERDKQCSVPREGHWRPGARWARRGRGQTVFEGVREHSPAAKVPSERERTDVEAAIEALPTHQRPPSRELGRVSEAAPNPFAGPAAAPAAGPLANAPREMAKRCEAATHPFKPESQDWEGRDLQDAIDALPAHQRPSAKSLLREKDVVANPLCDSRLAAAASAPPVQVPGEESPAKKRRAHKWLAQRGKRPTSRDGHAGEASSIEAPRLGRIGEGPVGQPEGSFFQTGRTLRRTVARASDTQAAEGQADRLPVYETPMATIETSGARVQLVAVCPAARAQGLRPGMALTTARAQVPCLETRPTDPTGDAQELAQLADLLARRWSPMVEICDTDGLLVDLTGTAHLHGGEGGFCRRLVRLLARHGFTARVAVADTPGAAWALARYGGAGPVCIAPPGTQEAAIAPLPPAALRLDPAALDLLDRLGVTRVVELAAMPRAPLVRRFTPAIVRRLDQALGREDEPLRPVAPEDAIVVIRRFLEPIGTAEAITQVIGDLAGDLATRLTQERKGVRSLELVAQRVDGVPQRLRTGFARPTRDAAHMTRMMVRRVEEIDPGFGVDAMALRVARADRLEAETLGPALVEETAPDLGPLVDAIINRIGEHRLWRLQPVESDVPERSVRAIAPLADTGPRDRLLEEDDIRRLDRTAPDHPWHPRWPRPVRLLPRPEAVQHVMSELPDQPPRRFTWRGRAYRVTGAEGPERITGEWWRREGERWASRDYYRVEAEGGERFWLFRRGDGVTAETGDLTWYLHGR